MRIVDIRERAIPLKSDMRNSSFDFSEMTTSVVAVLTDVVRDGVPVTGFAFNSTGRYACGAAMRASRASSTPIRNRCSTRRTRISIPAESSP
jgi:D(-)-tartrate dehydratase